MEAVLAAILSLCPHAHEPRELARAIAREATRYALPPALAVAVMARESTCRRDADSGRGDLGLYQVRRGITTRGYDDRTDEQLMGTSLNVHLGVRRLARARRRCRGRPLDWLGGYAGLSCGRSTYAERVVAAANSLDST